jgi:protein-L-isoaspartate(D-aspartate) O-methyltransferase
MTERFSLLAMVGSSVRFQRMKESQRLRRELVSDLVERSVIRTAAVEHAFLTVAREQFVNATRTPNGLESVYSDLSIVTREDALGQATSSSTAPSIMAAMIEGLAIVPGMNILEIGTGTGYNAAILRRLVGPRGRVTSIELDRDVAKDAMLALRRAGYNVSVVVGDGRKGFASHAPYDGILVTAAVLDVPRAWLEQLVPVGRIVFPLRLSEDMLNPQPVPVFTRRGQALESIEMHSSGFMPLRDAETASADDAELWVRERIGGEVRTFARLRGLALKRLTPRAREALLRTLMMPPRRRDLHPRLTKDQRRGFHAWLALTASRHEVCWGPDTWNYAVFDRRGTSLAAMASGGSCVACHGTPVAEARFLRFLERWRARGSPGLTSLRVDVRFGGRHPKAWHVVQRGEATLAFDWS